MGRRGDGYRLYDRRGKRIGRVAWVFHVPGNARGEARPTWLRTLIASATTCWCFHISRPVHSRTLCVPSRLCRRTRGSTDASTDDGGSDLWTAMVAAKNYDIMCRHCCVWVGRCLERRREERRREDRRREEGMRKGRSQERRKRPKLVDSRTAPTDAPRIGPRDLSSMRATPPSEVGGRGGPMPTAQDCSASR